WWWATSPPPSPSPWCSTTSSARSARRRGDRTCSRCSVSTTPACGSPAPSNRPPTPPHACRAGGTRSSACARKACRCHDPTPPHASARRNPLMSLIKQLWVAIGLITALSLGGSFIVSTLSARHYLEQELMVKNMDNASSLALSLSQMPKDDVTVELQIAAQFDAGHYRLIRLTSPAGAPLVEREYAGQAASA